jgi:nitroimidazol reductase NimA-like FMN-containing flavoprotein (pyridoxamine 5'-phosphate oxidase superfamily)
MKSELRSTAIALLDSHRLMTLATNRRDGWPQATMVGYANDELVIYFVVSRLSQKFANLKADPRVSAAIGKDYASPEAIKGISLAGRAAVVAGAEEYERASGLFLSRFPEFAEWPKPSPAISAFLKIKPEILSIIDYSKGFGHSDLVTVERSDFWHAAPQERSDWMATSS